MELVRPGAEYSDHSLYELLGELLVLELERWAHPFEDDPRREIGKRALTLQLIQSNPPDEVMRALSTSFGQ